MDELPRVDDQIRESISLQWPSLQSIGRQSGSTKRTGYPEESNSSPWFPSRPLPTTASYEANPTYPTPDLNSLKATFDSPCFSASIAYVSSIKRVCLPTFVK